MKYKNNCTLSDLLNVVMERFIPKLYVKCIEQNVRYTSCYKGYDQSIPFDIHGIKKWRADDMIEKLAKIQAGSKIYANY